MVVRRRINVTEASGNISLVEIVDKKIVNEPEIQELGLELLALVETERRHKIVLDFNRVQFFSHSVLGQLILLCEKIMLVKGRLVFLQFETRNI